jgi:hypothetical protein
MSLLRLLRHNRLTNPLQCLRTSRTTTTTTTNPKMPSPFLSNHLGLSSSRFYSSSYHQANQRISSNIHLLYGFMGINAAVFG